MGSERWKAAEFTKLTVLREVVREELPSTCIKSSETLDMCGLDGGFTYVRFHGKPAEGQTPIIGVFLVFSEYLIGLRVIPYAARNQVDPSAAYAG